MAAPKAKGVSIHAAGVRSPKSVAIRMPTPGASAEVPTPQRDPKMAGPPKPPQKKQAFKSMLPEQIATQLMADARELARQMGMYGLDPSAWRASQ